MPFPYWKQCWWMIWSGVSKSHAFALHVKPFSFRVSVIHIFPDHETVKKVLNNYCPVNLRVQGFWFSSCLTLCYYLPCKNFKRHWFLAISQVIYVDGFTRTAQNGHLNLISTSLASDEHWIYTEVDNVCHCWNTENCAHWKLSKLHPSGM